MVRLRIKKLLPIPAKSLRLSLIPTLRGLAAQCVAKTQEYVLKKFVKAGSAYEALKMDRRTPVSEVFLVDDKPKSGEPATAMGFTYTPAQQDEE